MDLCELPPVRIDEADLRRMNVPVGFWRLKLPGVSEKARTVMTHYLEQLPEMRKLGAGVMFGGPAGVGKSVAAAILLKECRKHRLTGYYTTVLDLREAIRTRAEFDTESSVFDRCRSVDALVLDGLSDADKSEKYHLTLRDIEELVLGRGERRKLTFMTTRMPLQTFDALGGFSSAVKRYLVYVGVEGNSFADARSKELRSKLF